MKEEQYTGNVDSSWGSVMVDSVHGAVQYRKKPFVLHADYDCSGDQQQAVDSLSRGIEEGQKYQTLKGVTGSGKTFTMAKIIEKVQRPALVLSHNKTLAAQLYREFKSFFPENAVEYFVSTYDYYQPEAYVPGKDLYIEKDADVNEEIDRMRMSAAFSLMERTDVIVVATVSCIFSLANPVSLRDMTHVFRVGMDFDYKTELGQLVRMQYERNDFTLERGTFRMRGDRLEIYPAYLTNAVRLTLDWETVTDITWFDPVSGEKQDSVDNFTLYPAKQFVLPPEQIKAGIRRIEEEKEQQYEHFLASGKILEAERIKTRVEYDMEMLSEIGYCSGIENYSRPLSDRKPGERPAVLLDYFPQGFVTFIDESHVTLPQVGAMYEGDHNRKVTLVEYGFRLPSALDNRPLRFDEFTQMIGQRIFVSATPGKMEKQLSTNTALQVIRPTGLLDPLVEVRPTEGQIEDLFGEISKCIAKGQRVLATTLTKRMAEELAGFFAAKGIKARYLHSDIETIERVEILRDLRQGKFDVLIGINLLREGLDLPEVALIAILDADKIGFLRSATSLIQTIGRAARNVDGHVIMYADSMSDAMREAIGETEMRREIQMKYNREHGITPTSIKKAVEDILRTERRQTVEDQKQDLKIRSSGYNLLNPAQRKAYIKELEKEMMKAAEALEFERAAVIRDQIDALKQGRTDVVESSVPVFVMP